MAQSGESYPKDMVTIEKATADSKEERVVTVVRNESEENAVKAAIGYMDAFNEADTLKTGTFINYPHARVGAGGRLVVSETAGTQMPDDFFIEFRKRYGWNHSCWDSREVIQSIETKVHLKVQFSRYRADGSKIGTFPSIWIMTKQDGHWGIKMRSSFAQ